MNTFRNILTTIWCAVIIGTNAFGLIFLTRTFGLDVTQEPVLLMPLSKMSLMIGFGIVSLISTKYLWFVLAVAVIALLFGLAYDVLVQRMWRPQSMLGAMVVIIPTYLLARWNSLVCRSNFNPVKEF